jgi:hypothetical protein
MIREGCEYYEIHKFHRCDECNFYGDDCDGKEGNTKAEWLKKHGIEQTKNNAEENRRLYKKEPWHDEVRSNPYCIESQMKSK